MTAIFREADAIAEAILRDVGSTILLGLPLGLGKANHIVNALYARAAADRSIKLTIFTAITLEPPKAGNDLERRFIEPLNERLFGGYPALAYAEAERNRSLPPNITVNEFFFLAGRWLSVASAQQNYISANYTHVVRYLLERGVNVVAQLVAKQVLPTETRYSLSCNTDLTLDFLAARKAGAANFKLVGQVNSELPFMFGCGDVAADTFSHVLDSPATDFPLFAPPKGPLGPADYAIGLRIARLVPDGGTLQIGIGEEGDAVAHSLILRHRNNAAFRNAVAQLARDTEEGAHHDAPFAAGLHGLSEMLVDAFLPLIDAGVVKREADGVLVQGGFFLGPRSFYAALRDMPEADRRRIRMTAISYINELYGDEAEKRRARVKARFINSTMMATLLGGVISDTLEDGRVVSGVGGQYNFCSQAFALDDARAIITVKATRVAAGKVESNIRWRYDNQTVPRHLRDIIVSEYGVADLRGKTDRDVIAAMLGIADSRFQPELLRQAKNAGKIEAAFELPLGQRQNYPERVAAQLAPFRNDGSLPEFPFGTDFTDAEQRLLPALNLLKIASSSPRKLAAVLFRNNFGFGAGADEACLDRLGLLAPKTATERVYRMMVGAALKETARRQV